MSVYHIICNALGTHAVLAKLKLYLCKSSKHRQYLKLKKLHNQKLVRKHLAVVKKELRIQSNITR